MGPTLLELYRTMLPLFFVLVLYLECVKLNLFFLSFTIVVICSVWIILSDNESFKGYFLLYNLSNACMNWKILWLFLFHGFTNKKCELSWLKLEAGQFVIYNAAALFYIHYTCVHEKVIGCMHGCTTVTVIIFTPL